PVIAIVDTNCDPDEVDYVIPGNDDAIRAVNLVTRGVAAALAAGSGRAAGGRGWSPTRLPRATGGPGRRSPRRGPPVRHARPAPSRRPPRPRSTTHPRSRRPGGPPRPGGPH